MLKVTLKNQYDYMTLTIADPATKSRLNLTLNRGGEKASGSGPAVDLPLLKSALAKFGARMRAKGEAKNLERFESLKAAAEKSPTIAAFVETI